MFEVVSLPSYQENSEVWKSLAIRSGQFQTINAAHLNIRDHEIQHAPNLVQHGHGFVTVLRFDYV